jgi:hypothetical protein
MSLPDWFTKNCHHPIDLDDGLREVSDAIEEQHTMRAIALLSIGMDVQDGFLSCRELLETIYWCVEGVPDGKRKLSEILGNNCNDYQRAIYYALAGRGAVGVLTDLKRLTDLMETRYLASRHAYANEMSQRVPENPYLTDGPDGPVGKFDPDFKLSELWREVAVSL